MNRLASTQATVLTAVGLFILLLFLNAIGLLRPIESVVGFVLKPVSQAIGGVTGAGGKSDLEKQNTELQEKVDQLTAELAKLQEAKHQNDALRAQLNFAQTNNFQLVEGNIISQDPTNFQQFFTIDRGSTSGIGKGMVVVSQGLLVGKIIDITATTAKVQLITDYNSAIPVLDQRTRATGLTRGQRGFGLVLENVPQTDQITSGDPLITSGFGGDYPRGLVIGTVGDVKRRDTDVYQTATVRPAADFRKLEAVFVITGQK